MRFLFVSRSGFSKDCKCCRESAYSERTVTLQQCYDQDGHKIQTGSLASMQADCNTRQLNLTLTRR